MVDCPKTHTLTWPKYLLGTTLTLRNCFKVPLCYLPDCATNSNVTAISEGYIVLITNMPRVKVLIVPLEFAGHLHVRIILSHLTGGIRLPIDSGIQSTFQQHRVRHLMCIFIISYVAYSLLCFQLLSIATSDDLYCEQNVSGTGILLISY